jgi:hypothetical protein
MSFRLPDFNFKGIIQVECVLVKFLDYDTNLLFYNTLRPVSRACSNPSYDLSPKQTPCLWSHLSMYVLGT